MGYASSRRKHNFAARQEFLTSSEVENDEFDVNLDGLRNQLTNTNTNTNTNNHPMDQNNDNDDSTNPDESTHIHNLHSRGGVTKLDPETTNAEDVVRAIKRAKNLHDVHDIREIAHFLSEEVGEFKQMFGVWFCEHDCFERALRGAAGAVIRLCFVTYADGECCRIS